MLTEDPKSLEDALKMINIQHVKIGNTWWLQHDEAQVNPWSVSYAGNVSILDSTWCQKCKDTKLWWLVSGRITLSQVSTLNDRANRAMGIIQSVRSDTVLATDLGWCIHTLSGLSPNGNCELGFSLSLFLLSSFAGCFV
jgi:hypothetical protein